MPTHRLLDAVKEAAMGDKKIGSTLKGIGPAYTDKYSRCGLRVGEILHEGFAEEYKSRRDAHIKIIEQSGIDFRNILLDGMPFGEYEKEWLIAADKLKQFRIVAAEIEINKALKAGKRILAEGAQGTMLDVDFGSYPYVTSSNTMTGGVCTGLGIAPCHVGKVFGIFKAYCTRVGNGPFPTELFDDMGEMIRKNGNEFGATTGRPRRTGWLDLPALRYSVMINGVTDLIMTKADVLTGIETISVCNSYKCGDATYDLPDIPMGCQPEILLKELDGWKCDLTSITGTSDFPSELTGYISFVENAAGVHLSHVSTGPDRNQLIKI
ncbi:Adenylosuccinate synthetase [bioreactor metagenome]|uniref:Adenylosuccinate synthetase n=1 Tax=bioreactor metagenome TaxID=1076179 RepID=A0A644WVX8_9ZZZZ